MDFILRVNMNNGTFKYPEAELKRILSKVICELDIGKVYNNIIDINGNTVGSWEIVTDLNIDKELEEFIECEVECEKKEEK